MELEYHPAASDEVARAVKWYEEIDSRLAEKFKLELARAEKLVLRSPATWGAISAWIKWISVPGIPIRNGLHRAW